MQTLEPHKKEIGTRQRELNRVADILVRHAYATRRSGGAIRISLIVLGALTATQGALTQLKLVPEPIIGIVFIALGAMTAICAGLESAMKFESRGAELNSLANSCHAMIRQAHSEWFKRNCPGPTRSELVRRSVEIVDMLDRNLREVQAQATTLGVNMALEVRRPYRKSLKRVGRDDDDDDDDGFVDNDEDPYMATDDQRPNGP
jgi:hypothetical protein